MTTLPDTEPGAGESNASLIATEGAAVDRTTFAARQAEMTARWFENVKAREGDVEAYIGKRKAAYLDRWREAARFIADGSSVLDIGGGNLFAELLELLSGRRFDYHYIDVDQAAVDDARRRGGHYGFNPERFATGFNDRLVFEDGRFDAVFSSHCIEQSFDLSATFGEIHRVLKPGGNLTMAVPLGWEQNPEHPYFFSPDEWIALVEDAGFRIRVCQSGCEYPERGYDLFIAAQKIAKVGSRRRIDPEDHRKTNYRFVPADDERIVCIGDVRPAGDQKILAGMNWTIEIAVPAGTTEICPVFIRHNWSGIVELTCAGTRTAENLFHWFAYMQPARMTLARPLLLDGVCRIRPLGASRSSWSSQGVILGALLR